MTFIKFHFHKFHFFPPTNSINSSTQLTQHPTTSSPLPTQHKIHQFHSHFPVPSTLLTIARSQSTLPSPPISLTLLTQSTHASNSTRSTNSTYFTNTTYSSQCPNEQCISANSTYSLTPRHSWNFRHSTNSICFTNTNNSS